MLLSVRGARCAVLTLDLVRTAIANVQNITAIASFSISCEMHTSIDDGELISHVYSPIAHAGH